MWVAPEGWIRSRNALLRHLLFQGEVSRDLDRVPWFRDKALIGSYEIRDIVQPYRRSCRLKQPTLFIGGLVTSLLASV
jgi:hypothetical protein